MIVNQKYELSEITVKVNKRELLYDHRFQRVIYTYDGINKEEFKLTLSKWYDLVVKYKLDILAEKYIEREM